MLPIYQFIEEIAASFKEQYDLIANHPVESQKFYTAQLRDSTISMANVIHARFPEYNMDKFYTAAGYVGTHPVHG